MPASSSPSSEKPTAKQGNKQSKAQRHEAARAKAFEMKRQQQKREARARAITLASVLVGLVVVIAVIVVIVQQGNKPTDVTATAPTTATAVDGGIPFGKDDVAGTVNEGAPTVEVYVDYICPACGAFEKANTANLDAMREAGDITLVLHPIAILDRSSSGTKYSTRAAAAVSYVADKDPDHALAFSEKLFANQPKEGGTGLTDDQIVSYAQEAGVPDDVASESVGGTFEDWVTQRTDAATSNTKLTGSQGFSTPTVLLDGTRYEGNWNDPDAFKKDVEALVD